jgi:hypothetical protein
MMGKGQVLDVGVLSSDVQKQLETLKLFPEIVERYYRATMNYAVVVLASTVRPLIPILSGRALQAFGSKVTGVGMRIQGEVGFTGKGKQSPYWIRIVNAGARAHQEPGYLNKKTGAQRLSKTDKERSPVMRIQGADGSIVFTHSISHPGFGGRHFMETGQASAEPKIVSLFDAANGMVIKELAK